jgi:hypothetical protein
VSDNHTSKKKTILPGTMDNETDVVPITPLTIINAEKNMITDELKQDQKLEFTLSEDEAAKQKFLDENQVLRDIEQVKDKDTNALIDLLKKAHTLPELSNKMDILTDDNDLSQSHTEVGTENLEETKNTPNIKFICTNIGDHRCEYLTEKGDANWCKPNAMFGGVRCQGESCGRMFVHTKVVNKETEFRPTNKRPLHVCLNETIRCTFAYCHDCYLRGMVNI